MKVKKRDGRMVEFDSYKIFSAVIKAIREVDGAENAVSFALAQSIAESIEGKISDGCDIEEIQDMVEKKLMASGRKDVAKAYIIYRHDRSKAREQNSKFMKAITEKLSASDVKNQNANVDERSFGGRKGEANNELLKKYALDYCVSELSKNNHINNLVYIHDLDSYAVGQHNCLSIPFDDLLRHGFNTRQTDVRPANSVSTAFQLVAVIFQLQSLQQFGGVSATHLDWTMVPYIRKSFYKHWLIGNRYISDGDEVDLYSPETPIDEYAASPATRYAEDMTRKEVYQAVEGMYHNLNTLQSRSGNQLPFTSINYGTCTSPEGRMVTKALLDCCIAGVGKLHKTSVFPCGIFQCMKGVNLHKGDPNYDLYRLALKSTTQRLYPNYANVDWSGNAGYNKDDPRTYFSTMG